MILVLKEKIMSHFMGVKILVRRATNNLRFESQW